MKFHIHDKDNFEKIVFQDVLNLTKLFTVQNINRQYFYFSIYSVNTIRYSEIGPS